MNKLYHVLFLVVIFLTQTLTANAQSDEETVSLSKLAKIEYQSIDEFNKPVTLTASITVPDSKPVTSVMLSNTSCNRISSVLASGSMETVAQWSLLTKMGFAVVEPDNSVVGDESLISIPKFTYNLAGRQTMDALYAAIEYLKQNGYITTEDYSTYNVGFGLGANVALAAQRSLEDDYTAEQKSQVRLLATFVGGCSDAPSQIWQNAIDNDSTYSAYKTVMMLDNVLKTYAEGCMKSFTKEDVFSQEFLDSYILELMYTDKFTEEQAAQLFASAFGTANPSISELVSDQMNQPNSAVRRAVEKALALNKLTDDWTPQYPIYGAANCPAVVAKIQGNYTDITEAVKNIDYNEVVNEIVDIIKDDLITAENQFLAAVFTKILGKTYFNLPILMYAKKMFFTGNLYVNSDLNTVLTLNIRSLFLSKVATLKFNLDANAVSVLADGLSGKIDATYYQKGQFDIAIDAKDIMPLIKGIPYLLATKTYATEADANAAADLLNQSINSFSIDVNGQPNWFTGSFAVTPGEESGTYVLDFLLNRNGESLSFASLKKILGA